MSQSLTQEEARDELAGLFNAAWAGMTPPAPLVSAPQVVYDDTRDRKPTDGAVAWARFNIRHAPPGGQRSIGSTGSRKFERRGFATVQIFTPKGDGKRLSDRLSKIALDAFEGKNTASGIFFRSTTTREVDEHEGEPWTQTNVLAEFTYDEVK